jgi:hypothetical protein
MILLSILYIIPKISHGKYNSGNGLEMVIKMEDATDHTEVMDNLKEWTKVKSKRSPYGLINKKNYGSFFL